jgi:hypothetical protein
MITSFVLFNGYVASYLRAPLCRLELCFFACLLFLMPSRIGGHSIIKFLTCLSFMPDLFVNNADFETASEASKNGTIDAGFMELTISTTRTQTPMKTVI